MAGKITPCLEIWYVSKHTHSVSENIPLGTKALLILLMLAFFCKKSAFFCKKSAFFGKNSTFTQLSSVTAVLEIF